MNQHSTLRNEIKTYDSETLSYIILTTSNLSKSYILISSMKKSTTSLKIPCKVIQRFMRMDVKNYGYNQINEIT